MRETAPFTPGEPGSLSLPPMRRIGFFIAWELFNPLHPGSDTRKPCLEAIKAQRQRSCFGVPGGPQQELQAWIGDDVGGCELGARQPNAAYGTFFQSGEAKVDLLTHFFRLLGGESRSEEDRAVHALARRPEIRDELGDALENPAGLLGSAPEKRSVWVLAIKIDHDCKGFMEREIAVADHGNAAKRIDGEELRSLELAL